MKQNDLSYKPSLIARVGGFVLPILKKTLPPSVYGRIYVCLYSMYYNVLRYSYWRFRVISLFKSKRERMKSELVWALLPFTMGGRRALENAFDIVEMVENQSIPGDIVECGVARGGTAAMLSVASLRLGTISRRKWLFDSYEGLPEPTIEDYVNGKAGNFIQPLPKGSCLGTLEQVSQLMYGKYCFSRDDVVLVEGWFQDTVPQYKNIIDKISILRLDGDWYESTKIPLDNFFDKIVNGGFVIVDDYATCFGSRKATDEFRAERGIETPLIPDGRGGVWFQKKS